MVHALESIHRLLKPSGALIDIHPVAESSPLEIHQGATIDQVGYLSVPQWCLDSRQADDALADVARRGLFTLERSSKFDALTYYDSAGEMASSVKESIDKFARDASAIEAVPQAQALAERAGQTLRAAGVGAELVIRERTHISRLKR